MTSKTTCKMKCKDCTDIECKRRGDPNMKCFYEEDLQEELEENFDWQSFRTEAAKDILCAMIGEVIKQRNGSDLIDNTVRSAIVITDNLISKLKEKERK